MNIGKRIRTCLWVINFYLYLGNTIQFLVKQFIKIIILCLKKSALVLRPENLDDNRNSIYFQWYSLALDIFESQIFKTVISKSNRKAPTNVGISFRNHAYQLISNSMILPLCTHSQIQSGPKYVTLINQLLIQMLRPLFKTMPFCHVTVHVMVL